MLSSVFILIVKFVCVIILLMAMVMVLLGIGHLSQPLEENDKTSTNALRKELKKSNRVISRHSIFHSFLVRKH